MSTPSNLKRHLLSTGMPIPRSAGITDFSSTMAGQIFAYTKAIPPVSARLYAQAEFEKYFFGELKYRDAQTEITDEMRERRIRLTEFVNNVYLPAMARWERAMIEAGKGEGAGTLSSREADPDVLSRDIGCTHRVEAWIHPVTGDDYRVTFYGRGAVNHNTIQELIRRQGCTVTTDYSVVAL